VITICSLQKLTTQANSVIFIQKCWG